jgi:hypothetical protein
VVKPPADSWWVRARKLVGNNKILAAVVVGLIVGLLGARLLHQPSRPSTTSGNSALGRTPTTTPSRSGATTTVPPGAQNNDPAASALSSLVVKPADVSSTFLVTLLPGGNGLSQPTLDLCNGTFPSESGRSARLQDYVLDDQQDPTLSTEAVLYQNPAAAAQAMSELKSVAAACPSTPVVSPVTEPTVITKFNPAPDGSWPQTPTVNRLAFDFTSTDATGQTTHSVAVYLQRGRALLGVYFPSPDGPQAAVAGQTTVSGIVGVFAGRLAALPASVVGS